VGPVSGIGYCGCIAVGRGGLFGAGTLYTIVGGHFSLVVDHVVPCIRHVVYGLLVVAVHVVCRSHIYVFGCICLCPPVRHRIAVVCVGLDRLAWGVGAVRRAWWMRWLTCDVFAMRGDWRVAPWAVFCPAPLLFHVVVPYPPHVVPSCSASIVRPCAS